MNPNEIPIGDPQETKSQVRLTKALIHKYLDLFHEETGISMDSPDRTTFEGFTVAIEVIKWLIIRLQRLGDKP
jgi:hypothetical protein